MWHLPPFRIGFYSSCLVGRNQLFWLSETVVLHKNLLGEHCIDTYNGKSKRDSRQQYVHIVGVFAHLFIQLWDCQHRYDSHQKGIVQQPDIGACKRNGVQNIFYRVIRELLQSKNLRQGDDKGYAESDEKQL